MHCAFSEHRGLVPLLKFTNDCFHFALPTCIFTAFPVNKNRLFSHAFLILTESFMERMTGTVTGFLGSALAGIIQD